MEGLTSHELLVRTMISIYLRHICCYIVTKIFESLSYSVCRELPLCTDTFPQQLE